MNIMVGYSYSLFFIYSFHSFIQLTGPLSRAIHHQHTTSQKRKGSFNVVSLSQTLSILLIIIIYIQETIFSTISSTHEDRNSNMASNVNGALYSMFSPCPAPGTTVVLNREALGKYSSEMSRSVGTVPLTLVVPVQLPPQKGTSRSTSSLAFSLTPHKLNSYSPPVRTSTGPV